jgi:16S rRNA (guanine527-N7)-methyltransferase
MFHVKHEGWSFSAELMGAVLPSGAAAKLDRYERILLDKAAPMGMISANDLPRIRDRHILDCLRAAPVVGTDARSAVDLGSGAGLPGIVIAIALPDLRVTLVEVRRTRAVFLTEAVAELELSNVSIYARRAETLRTRVGWCFARAFASARDAWSVAEPRLEPDGRLLYWAGVRFDPDVDLPKGVSVSLFRTPALARSGSLAIMTRQ